MNNRVFSKKYSLYDSSSSVFLPVMLMLFCVLSIALSGFFMKRFLIDDYDPSAYILLALTIGPWAYVIVSLQRNGLLKRLFLRLYFDENGIHCFLLEKKRYLIAWEDIHTYGFTDCSFSYASRSMMIFSTDPKEFVPKNRMEANRISPCRIIIQYRSDVWAVMKQVMPADMCEKLGYAISKKQDCFHKR